MRWSVTANFCLQTFPAAIWVFAINYLKYWNYHKYRGAAAYLLAPATTFPAALVTYLSDHQPLLHRTTFGRGRTRTKIGHKSDTLAIQWRTRDQVIKSSATHLNWEGPMQKMRICRISFGGLLQNPLLFAPRHFGRRQPPALQSLFICFPNQNLICLQFNLKFQQTWFLQFSSPNSQPSQKSANWVLFDKFKKVRRPHSQQKGPPAKWKRTRRRLDFWFLRNLEILFSGFRFCSCTP